MRHRIDAIKKRIQTFHLDAFVVSSPAHIRYLFGFTGSNAIGLIRSDQCVLLTDKRYTDQARLEVQEAHVRIADKDLFSELSAWKTDLSEKKLGLEVEHLSARDFFRLKKILPDTSFVASERIVERISCIKEDSEVDSIRAAATICGKVFKDIRPLIRTGVSELQISAEITYRAKLYGSEKDPFEPIVASGERSALPHGLASGKIIAEGELIIVDFGATVNGYAADCTRTFFTGKINEKQQMLIRIISEALALVETTAKSGMPCKQLDAVARAHIAAAGYGEYFMHSLGHGLGLSVHELPRIGETSDDILQNGQVITMEPGIYVPGTGGVRIEDDYLVTDDCVEILSPFPREVLCVS